MKQLELELNYPYPLLAITEKNIDKVCSYVLEQMEDNNGRGEFDHLTPLSSAIERTIGSFEEEHFDYLDYIKDKS